MWAAPRVGPAPGGWAGSGSAPARALISWTRSSRFTGSPGLWCWRMSMLRTTAPTSTSRACGQHGTGGGGGGRAHAAGCGQVGKPPALAAAAAAARQQRATMHLSRPGAVGPCCSSLLLALILRDLHAESRGSKFGRPPMHRCPRPQVAGGQPATSCSMAMLARALSCRALSSCLSICTRSTTGARPDGPPPSPVSSDSRPAAHHALSVGRQASGRRERARHGTHDWTRASCRVWRAAVADGPHPRRNAWGVRSCVCRRPRRQRTWWL